jgi:hypothetical protein
MAKAEAARVEAEKAAIAKLQAQQAAADAKYEAEKAASALAKAEAAAMANVEQKFEQVAVTKAPPPSAEPSADMLGGLMGKGKGMISQAGVMIAPGEMVPGSGSDESTDFLSGVGGKGIILPLIAGFAVLSVAETTFYRVVDDNARKTGGKLDSDNDPYSASNPSDSWLKTVLGGPPAAGGQEGWNAGPSGAPAKQLRSAPDIFFGGLGNLAQNPLGWAFGPPSPLYSNTGPAAARRPASSQPITYGPATEPWAAAPAAPDYSMSAEEAAEEVAKQKWLAAQSAMQAEAQESTRDAEPWAAAPKAPTAAPQPVPQPRGVPAARPPPPEQAADGYLQDPSGWSNSK